MPWYRVAYDNLFFLLGDFYTPALVAMLLAVPIALHRRDAGYWILLIWAGGVLAAALLSATKTPAAGMLAIPPLALLGGNLLSRAVQGDGGALAFCSGLGLMFLIAPPVGQQLKSVIPTPWEMASLPDWPAARWVVWQLCGTAVIGWALLVGHAGKIRALRIFVAVAGLLLAFENGVACFRITQMNRSAGTFPELSGYIRTRLPKNAVIIFDDQSTSEVQDVAFRSVRTCYSFKVYQRRLGLTDFSDMARKIRENGGLPYLVSFRNQPNSVVKEFPDEARTLFKFEGEGSAIARLDSLPDK
jgi:hypothetical protein